MKPKAFLRGISLFVLLFSLLPASNASAVPLQALPPADMFQLPWQQGEAWIALDGLDNGTRRSETSPHNYKNGGAVDFTPNKDVSIGTDTSNFWVTAAAAGTIIELSSCHMKINHGNGWITEYQHLSNIQVGFGEAVYRNQRLGVIDDNSDGQVCPGNEFPYPHLHFVLRPEMQNATLAGWLIGYDPSSNVTSFSKDGNVVTNWSYQPILNIPNLQIALRDPITWDIVYIGTLDTYRYERWPFTLIETQEFTLTATPTTNGLLPILVLLDAGGNEIARGTGTLTSTQPAGNYFVQVQPETGQGFYNLLLQKGTSPGKPTPTPTPTSGGPGGTTPTPTPTSGGPGGTTLTPTPTSGGPGGTTPTPTPTSGGPGGPTPTSTPTSGGPGGTTPTPTPTSGGPGGTTPTPTPTSGGPGGTTPTPTPTSGGPGGTTPTPTPTSGGPGGATPTPTSTPDEPYPTIESPGGVEVGETILVTVYLHNVPPSGYTSAEFTCTYPPDLVAASNVLVAGLFGTDPVSAINGPLDGAFILAIAGSNGQRATTSGAVFSFNLTGLKAGLASIACVTRVSTGDGALIDIGTAVTDITVVDGDSMSASTPVSDMAGSLLTGQVYARKPVTIRLYNPDNSLAVSALANADGTFSLAAPPGTYTVAASASGFLSAQGPAVITTGGAATKATIGLLAGDVDGNGVIDQYDAMTIAMNYNTAAPDAADLNADGLINVLDLETLAANYRATETLIW